MLEKILNIVASSFIIGLVFIGVPVPVGAMEEDVSYSGFNYRKASDLQEEKQKHIKKKGTIYNLTETNKTHQFEQIPSELYKIIFNKLNSLDAIHLAMTSKGISGRLTQFWEEYIKHNALKKWDSSISAIRIVYANRMFKEGNLEKAAKLGFPKAIQALQHRDKKNNNDQYNEFLSTFFSFLYTNIHR